MGREKLKAKKTFEFSKKILIVAGIINICVIIFTFLMVWRTNDLSPLEFLIPSVAAEVSVGTGFYYSKAKIENKIKLMKSNKVPISENTFKESEDIEYETNNF